METASDIHVLIDLTSIDDIRIARRPWDERLQGMIARLKQETFWQKHKQTLVSRGQKHITPLLQNDRNQQKKLQDLKAETLRVS